MYPHLSSDPSSGVRKLASDTARSPPAQCASAARKEANRWQTVDSRQFISRRSRRPRKTICSRTGPAPQHAWVQLIDKLKSAASRSSEAEDAAGVYESLEV